MQQIVLIRKVVEYWVSILSAIYGIFCLNTCYMKMYIVDKRQRWKCQRQFWLWEIFFGFRRNQRVITIFENLFQNQFISNQFSQSGPFQSQPASGASVPCQFPTTFPSQLSSTHQQPFSGNPASAIGNVNFASAMPGNNAAFFGNQSMQQQFGNLTLNGAAAATPTPNIWQQPQELLSKIMQ